MTTLRDDFIKTGKRFYVYLDDDIQFLNSDIIKNSLDFMVEKNYGIVSVYSTFDASVLNNPYDPKGKGLIARNHNFAVGYFIMVDSKKVGNILPDINMPDPNLAIDADYSVAARAAGFNIGIAAEYVYHLRQKEHPGIPDSQPTIDYLRKKWGEYYFHYTQYGGAVIEWGTESGNTK